jgi:magnesium transporter
MEIESVTDDERMGLIRESEMKPQDSHSLQYYLDKPIFQVLKQRLPWLVGLLVFQSFSASILGAFEDLLEKHLVISFFVPMIVGTGGNAGNQPGVMITRALGAKQVNPTNFRQILWKELKLALMTAFILGFVAYCRVLVDHPSEHLSAFAIALTIGLVVLVA